MSTVCFALSRRVGNGTLPTERGGARFALPTLLFELSHQLYMRREQELVDGDHARDAVAAIGENAQVARAGAWIA